MFIVLTSFTFLGKNKNVFQVKARYSKLKLATHVGGVNSTLL